LRLIRRFVSSLINQGNIVGIGIITSRGWTAMGMDFIFHELQVSRLAEKGLDPLKIAHRMLKNFTRGLYIETGLEDDLRLWPKALEISREFQLRLEKTAGSLNFLKQTLYQALKVLEK
jgi:hypothetical protein